MVAITISAKNMDPEVKYTLFDNKVNFLTDSLRKEVMDSGRQTKKIRQLKKLLKVSISALATMISIAPKTFAMSPMGTMTTSTSEAITPTVVMKWGMTIALVSVSAGIALGAVMLSVAGIYKMFRKRKEANEWTQDIIKGLVQVLISVPTVFVLYFLAQFLFGRLTVLKALF